MPNVLIKSTPATRNYGIDLLRNLSMFFIVVLHILGDGGMLAAVKGEPLKHEVLKVFHIAAMCAVNCYGLISGYIDYQSKFKLSNILTLWLQVFLYSAGIGVIVFLIKPGVVPFKLLISLFMPTILCSYWYFTAYFALFFTMPLLNLAIERLSQRQLEICLGVLLFLVTVCQQTIVVQDIFGTKSGYSYLWLALLYCTGGYLGKYHRELKKPMLCLWGYAGCVAVCWLAQFCMGRLGMEKPTRLEMYNSPVMFLEGVLLLLLFANMKLPDWLVRLTVFLAPASFGVYLIYVHPVIWNNFWKGAFSRLGEYPVWSQLLLVIGMAATVYILCSVVDLVRHYLFRLLKIKEIATKIDRKVFPKDGGKV